MLAHLPAAVAPWKNPIFVQFVSHKLGRLFVPWALMAMFVTNLFMLHGIYAVTFSLQAAWYLFATAGYFLSKREVAAPVLIPDESRKAA